MWRTNFQLKFLILSLLALSTSLSTWPETARSNEFIDVNFMPFRWRKKGQTLMKYFHATNMCRRGGGGGGGGGLPRAEPPFGKGLHTMSQKWLHECTPYRSLEVSVPIHFNHLSLLIKY